jgi:hypothetical protein
VGLAVATAKDFRRIALSLDGTSAAPHFDRTAFRVRRIYATLAGDGKTANLEHDCVGLNRFGIPKSGEF